MKKSFYCVFAIITSLCRSNLVNAQAVNFSGPNLNLGQLATGQYGTINGNINYEGNSGNIFFFGGNLSALLPAGDELILSTSTNNLHYEYPTPDVVISDTGSYNYTSSSADNYQGSLSAALGYGVYSQSSNQSTGTVEAVTSVPLLTTTLGFNPAFTEASYSITNNSDPSLQSSDNTSASVSTSFYGQFTNPNTPFAETYQVVSVVPEPASLGLIASAGLVGLARRRRLV